MLEIEQICIEIENQLEALEGEKGNLISLDYIRMLFIKAWGILYWEHKKTETFNEYKDRIQELEDHYNKIFLEDLNK